LLSIVLHSALAAAGAASAGAAKAITGGNVTSAQADEETAQIEYDDALAACPPTNQLTGDTVVHVQFMK
jgi:hypothetical protein